MLLLTSSRVFLPLLVVLNHLDVGMILRKVRPSLSFNLYRTHQPIRCITGCAQAYVTHINGGINT